MEKIPLGIAESSQRVVFALNRAAYAIITAEDTDDLFQRVCSAIALDAVVRVAWIGFARDDDGKTIEVAALAGSAGDYFKTLVPCWGDGAGGIGPSGEAIRTGHIQVMNAISENPKFAGLIDVIDRLGARSAIAIPFAIEENPRGVLTIVTTRDYISREHEFAELALQCRGLTHGMALHRQRRQARDTEARLAAIVQSSGDAIIGRDMNGLITSWNAAAERIFGFTAADALGKTMHLVTPRDRNGEVERLLARVKQGEDIVQFDTKRITKSGRKIDVALTMSPIRDVDGVTVGISTIARDVTSERAIETRVRELSAEILHISRVSELGQFASALAHELNQPFAAVMNYLAAARQSLKSDEPVKRDRGLGFLDLANGEIERAAEIVRRMRRMVEKAPLERGPALLTTLVEEACSLATVGARLDNITIVSHFETGLAPIAVDRIQIQQVVVNLVRNALDSLQQMAQTNRKSAREAVLTLRVFAGGDGQQEILVADTGPGVAKEIADRLFMPFVTSKDGGMGLGLSISQSIIEAHAGSLWFEPNPGGGAVFRCSLPSFAAQRTGG